MGRAREPAIGWDVRRDMSAHRFSALEQLSPAHRPSRTRPLVAVGVAVVAHLGLLAGGFLAARGEAARAPRTEVVTVLSGQVAPNGTGDFQAQGFRQA